VSTVASGSRRAPNAHIVCASRSDSTDDPCPGQSFLREAQRIDTSGDGPYL
jgi:hypothetical protein